MTASPVILGSEPVTFPELAWASAAKELANRPEGLFYSLNVPAESISTCRSTFTAACSRVGFRVKSRVIDGRLIVARTSEVVPPRPRKQLAVRESARDAEIIDMVSVRGSTYQAAADRFLITRQRVEQIVRGYANYRRLPRTNGDAEQAAMAFLAPYISAAPVQRRCLACRKENSRASSTLCARCGRARRVVLNLCSRLREIAAGNHRYMAIATYVIKRHGLQPADLELL